MRDEPVDDRAEAHVEHAVGLVEHEHARPRRARRRRGRSGRRGGRASRRARRRCARALDLRADAGAAVDGGDREARGRGRSRRARRRSGWRARASARARARAGGAAAPGSMRSTSGIPNASVLPEPVGDSTSTSWPASTSGTTSLLHGERRLDAARAQRAGHGLGHAEIGEGGLLHMVLLAWPARIARGRYVVGEIRLSPTARCAFRSKNLRARRRRTRCAP